MNKRQCIIICESIVIMTTPDAAALTVLKRYRRRLHKYCDEGDLEAVLWYQWLNTIVGDVDFCETADFASLLSVQKEMAELLCRLEGKYLVQTAPKKKVRHGALSTD